MIRLRPSDVASDKRGATIIEFALIVPTMLLLIMGLAELSYRNYVQSVLTGAMQKAARDSAIQGGAQQNAALDQSVMSMVWTVSKLATYTSTRKSYARYGLIKGEPFTDAPYGSSPADGICNHGEPYTDTNGNNQYDIDPGASGQGGASDADMYTMTVTYPNLFPIQAFLGWPPTQTIRSMTILKNQPFATQIVTGTTTKTCP